MATNKISLTALKVPAPEPETISLTLGGETHQVTISPRLDLKEMLAFADEVARTCVDTEAGRYFPEIRAFCIRKNLVSRYTNVRLPTSLRRQYELLDPSGLPEAVLPHIDRAQFDEIVEAIDDKIDFLLGSVLSTAQWAMRDITQKLQDITGQTERLFGGIDGDALGKVVEKFAALDPEGAPAPAVEEGA